MNHMQAYRGGSLGAQHGAFQDGSLGHPLYVNGQLFQQPVTISHVPGAAAGLGNEEFNRRLASIYPVFSLIGAACGAYHGYARNNSAGWAVAWGLFGAAFPILSIPISMAQGFGEPKRRTAHGR